MSEPIVAGRATDALVAEKVFGWKRGVEHRRPLHRESRDFPGQEINDWDDKGPHPYAEDPEGNQAFYACWCRFTTGTGTLPDYSTEFAAAWEVVEKLNAEGWTVVLSSPAQGKGEHEVQVVPNVQFGFVSERAETMPLAVCRVALRAMEALK